MRTILCFYLLYILPPVDTTLCLMHGRARAVPVRVPPRLQQLGAHTRTDSREANEPYVHAHTPYPAN